MIDIPLRPPCVDDCWLTDWLAMSAMFFPTASAAILIGGHRELINHLVVDGDRDVNGLLVVVMSCHEMCVFVCNVTACVRECVRECERQKIDRKRVYACLWRIVCILHTCRIYMVCIMFLTNLTPQHRPLVYTKTLIFAWRHFNSQKWISLSVFRMPTFFFINFRSCDLFVTYFCLDWRYKNKLLYTS